MMKGWDDRMYGLVIITGPWRLVDDRWERPIRQADSGIDLIHYGPPAASPVQGDND